MILFLKIFFALAFSNAVSHTWDLFWFQKGARVIAKRSKGYTPYITAPVGVHRGPRGIFAKNKWPRQYSPRTRMNFWLLLHPQWIFLKFTEFFVNPVNLTKVDFSTDKTTLVTLECIPVTHVAPQWLKWHPGDSILDPGDSILYPGALGCTLADFSTPTRAVRKCVVIK